MGADSQIEQLVEELRRPHTRRLARKKLVELRAVDALLGVLNSPNESVVWAGVQSLGELRAGEAVEPLLQLLERDVLPMDAAEALTRITGQDGGVDAKRWRELLGSSGASGAGSAPLARVNVESVVRDAAELLGAEPEGSGDRFQFTLDQPGGRRQKVQLRSGRVDRDDDELLLIYSVCGPAVEKYYEDVLRKNVTMPAGAFAIHDIDGQACFVIVDSLLTATLTARQLAKSIDELATRADIVERGLTKDDRR